MSLKNRIILTFGLLNLFVFTILTLVTIKLTNNKMNSDLQSQLNASSEYTASYIEDVILATSKQFLDIHSNMNLNSVKFNIKNYGKKEALKNLIERVESTPIYGQGFSFLSSADGKIIGKSPDFNPLLNINPLPFSDKETILWDIKYFKKDKFVYYNIFIQELRAIITTAVRTKDAIELIGTEEFNKMVSNIKVGEKGYPFIIDSSGILISHPTKEGEHALLTGSSYERELIASVLESFEGLKNYTFIEADGTKEEKIAMIKPVKGTDWTVVTSGYKKDYFSQSATVKKILIACTLAGITLNILALLLLSEIIVKPKVKGL